MSRVSRTALHLLGNIRYFSELVIRLPLRRYQVEPLDAILDSIINGQGLEFLMIFPRQSGKNEAVAQLLAYLLNLFKRVGGNIVYGATGPNLGMGIERLEDRLDNAWSWGCWTKKTRPARRCLGQATVVFLSSHPAANTRGQTAHLLLVIDETQDQVGAHIEAVFTPMRAANNATALYIGTVKTTHDYLWQKKAELERETARDGIRRVFFVQPEEVCRDNPAYKAFLDAQVRKHGRHHPIIASEYYLEPIDGAGGLFPPRRRLLMRGTHPRLDYPIPGEIYVATLDVAGEDEAATDPIAQLARPGRDYTLGHIFRVVFTPPGVYAAGPTYEAVDVFVDHGSKHFQDHDGRPALCHRLLAWLQAWGIGHLVADESGVGQGLVSWLKAALGAHLVTGYDFAGSGKKAGLGSLFLSLVETGRFRYWACEVGAHGDAPPCPPLSDGWWFWAQVEACTYELPPDGRFDRDLRWEVPPSHKTPVPDVGATTRGCPRGCPRGLPTHDDRLLSAALIAEFDRLYRTAGLVIGQTKSAVVPAKDPYAAAEMGEVF